MPGNVKYWKSSNHECTTDDTIELHVIGFEGDCYGKGIDVQFVESDFREERKIFWT